MAKEKISSEEAQTKREIEQILQETKEVQAELLSWENEKEPEPDRQEEVIKNREELAKETFHIRNFISYLSLILL